MNKQILLAAVAFMMALASCNNAIDGPDEPIIEPTTPTLQGVYVLNSGLNGRNDASLSFVTMDGQATNGVFMAKNGRGLGDTANDMIRYGSKLYIAVSGSQTLEVTDLEGNSVAQFTLDGQPRSLASFGKYVYVTLFNGYVARIDTAASIALGYETTPVGRNPENIVYMNGKLYVANSGGLDYATEVGYDRTVSVIDVATFKETKKLDVAVNPIRLIEGDPNKEDIYLISMGDYATAGNVVQRIDTRTDAVTVVEGLNATEMAGNGETMYVFYSAYDESWNMTTSYFTYDMINGVVNTTSFLSDVPANPYKLYHDKSFGLTYLTETDYVTDGNLRMYDAFNRNLVYNVEVGSCPIKVVPVVEYAE
jgi:hypothetical protein